MKLSARNVLAATVKSVTPGAVDTEVVVELAPGIEIVSIITKKIGRSARAQGGRQGVRRHQSIQRDDRRRLSRPMAGRG